MLTELKERLTTVPEPRWYLHRTPLGADHLVALDGTCMTCGRHDHPGEFSAADNCSWIAGTLFLKDRDYAQALAAAGAAVALEMRR